MGLNVTTDLSFFDAIVPCGITGCRMTSVAEQGLGTVSCEAFGHTLAKRFAAAFGYRQVSKLTESDVWSLVDPAGYACEARA
jgi:lipoate-protein ligase B